MIDLKIVLSKIVENFKTETMIGDYTLRAQQINSSLTTSSSDSDWLKAALRAICIDYPGITNHVFKGILCPNSRGYFEVFIYNTDEVVSSIPMYCNGTWRKWSTTFAIFHTSSGTFTYTAK